MIDPIPSGARLLHIGPHKTGSTALQVSLRRARAELSQHGVVYPGVGARPRHAGWALGIRGGPVGKPPPSMEHWKTLVREVAEAGSNRVCISNEDFGRATEQQIKQLVAGLGDERVRIVAVARRYDRYLPSQWQEYVKAGDTRSYPEWLRVVLDIENSEYDEARHNVWFSHDTPALVRRWADVIGLDRITVIASDESDRSQHVRTFEQLLALPRDTLSLHVERSIQGLSWWETEFIRQLNVLALQQVDEVWDYPTRKLISRKVIKELTSRAGPSDGPRKPPLPNWAVDPIRTLSQQRVDALASLGVEVIGRLDDLLLPDDVETGELSDDVLIGSTSAAIAVAALLNQRAKARRAAQSKAVGSAAPAPADGRLAKARKSWWPGLPGGHKVK